MTGPDVPMPIDVVAAVIEVDERFLVTRRQAGVHLEGYWEFPGGKVHDGESRAKALARELREELDVHATVSRLMLSTTHAYPEKTVVVHFYQCGIAGTPRPMQGQQMRWISRADLRSREFPAADQALIEMLVAAK